LDQLNAIQRNKPKAFDVMLQNRKND